MRELFVYLRGLTLFVAGIVVGTVMISPSLAQQPGNGLRLNHVGIAVKDFQESLNFYTKVMGFKAAYSMPSPDGKPTTTFLQISRDTFIEMAPATPPKRAIDAGRHGAPWGEAPVGSCGRVSRRARSVPGRARATRDSG